jgi:hypothetical protein
VARCLWHRRRLRHRPAHRPILTEIPVAQSGQGSGIQSTFRQVGSALGIAILGAILVTTLGSRLRGELRHIPGLPPARQAATVELVRDSGGSAIVGLRRQAGSEQVVAASARALADAARTAAFTGAAFVLLGLGATLRLPNPRGAPEEDHDAGAEDSEDDVPGRRVAA